MITRIKIEGFKSLLDTELYFGPFTCIAGANAAGKSNFFDALMFLSKLADETILQAARAVRSENQKHTNIRDIFFKSGERYVNDMSFEVDMIIPQSGEDDLGQLATATITSIRYALTLQFNQDDEEGGAIRIKSESLIPIKTSEMKKNMKTIYNKEWLESALKRANHASTSYISTSGNKIRLHQDGGNKGRSFEFIAEKMPRTLLSSTTAESPTSFLVRQEMRRWMMLQFEPSALRQPNTTFEIRNAQILPNGSHLPATLYRLHSEKKEIDLYQILTNRLKNLIDNVTEIEVDKDEKRDLLTLQLKFKDGLTLPTQSLSDGTLRFLGLSIIEVDRSRGGLICLEEPENGINPLKVRQMVSLLENMATDPKLPIDDENPLRQVIINTHSPLVVGMVFEDSLLLAKTVTQYNQFFDKQVNQTIFAAMPDTWRTDNHEKVIKMQATTMGEIFEYLGKQDDAEKEPDNTRKTVNRRMIQEREKQQRKQLQQKAPELFDDAQQ